MNAEKSLMEELYASTLKDIKEGEVSKGIIAAITAKEVIVDIGFKSEGFVPIEEFRNPAELAIGQSIEVLIENIEDDHGRLILSYAKAERLKGWQKLSDDINEGDILEGRSCARSRVVISSMFLASRRFCRCHCPLSRACPTMISPPTITNLWWPR